MNCDPKFVRFGSLVQLDEEWYIVSQVDTNKYALISLLDGNRWTDPKKYNPQTSLGVTSGFVLGVPLEQILCEQYTLNKNKGGTYCIRPPLSELEIEKLTDKRIAKTKKVPMSMPPSLTTLKKLINSTKGKIFTVCFEKKDGTSRIMNCRLGVSKYVKGTGTATSRPTNLITVYDLQAKGYRSFYLQNVLWVKVSGLHYHVYRSNATNES